MQLSHSISIRIREVLLNGTWIANTNFKSQLENINWQQAIFKIENLNSIAALTFHINYYLAGLINVFEGGTLDIKDKFSFDLPEIKNENDWQKLKIEFENNAEKFATHVSNMSDEFLLQPFVDEKYGNYLRNIEGVIEHSYYHLGQVVLIKKMMR
jgi:uncharacterized damage-inducible protein DinB